MISINEKKAILIDDSLTIHSRWEPDAPLILLRKLSFKNSFEEQPAQFHLNWFICQV